MKVLNLRRKKSKGCHIKTLQRKTYHWLQTQEQFLWGIVLWLFQLNQFHRWWMFNEGWYLHKIYHIKKSENDRTSGHNHWKGLQKLIKWPRDHVNLWKCLYKAFFWTCQMTMRTKVVVISLHYWRTSQYLDFMDELEGVMVIMWI